MPWEEGWFWFLFLFFFSLPRKRRKEDAKQRRGRGWASSLAPKPDVLSPNPHGFLVNGPQFLVSSNWWIHFLSCSTFCRLQGQGEVRNAGGLEKGKTWVLWLLWDYCRKIIKRLGSSRLELWALWMGRFDFWGHSMKYLSCDTENSSTKLGLRGK